MSIIERGVDSDIQVDKDRFLVVVGSDDGSILPGEIEPEVEDEAGGGGAAIRFVRGGGSVHHIYRGVVGSVVLLI